MSFLCLNTLISIGIYFTDLPCTNITGVYLGNVKIIVVLRAILINKFQFADMFGVSRQAVSKWEPDNGYPETQEILTLQQSGINNII